MTNVKVVQPINNINSDLYFSKIEKSSKESSSQNNDMSILRGHHDSVHKIKFFDNDDFILSASRDRSGM
jgi:WD domain, G-beta repeat.